MTKPARTKAASTLATKQPRATSRSKSVKVESTDSVQPSTHQQYPQIQFVHVPYSVPNQAIAPPAAQQPPQPVALESIFQDTLQRLHDLESTLSNCQTVTQRALVRHQHEQRKWQLHCMSFKQERDSARTQVLFLLQERAKILGHHRSSTPAVAATTAEPGSIASTSDNRKAGRDSRKHAPYSGSIRRSSSPIMQSTPSCSASSSTPLSKPSRSLSLPPSFSFELSSLASPPPPSSSDASSTATTREKGSGDGLGDFEFATFDPLRKSGDATAFEVSFSTSQRIVPNFSDLYVAQVRLGKGTGGVTTRAAPHLLPEDDSESDMDLGSDDEDTEEILQEVVVSGEATAMVLDDCSEPTSPTIDIQHLDLLYTPALGRLRCRTCLLRCSRNESDALNATSFETDSDWEELRAHALSVHPTECARLARLDSVDLRYLRQRGTR